jgi:hypothetical protein
MHITHIRKYSISPECPGTDCHGVRTAVLDDDTARPNN